MRPLEKVGFYLFSGLEAMCGAIASSSIDFFSGLEPSPLHREICLCLIFFMLIQEKGTFVYPYTYVFFHIKHRCRELTGY
jgi:hypothetical protein